MIFEFNNIAYELNLVSEFKKWSSNYIYGGNNNNEQNAFYLTEITANRAQ